MINKLYLVFLAVFLLPAPVYANEVLIASGHDEYPPFMWREGDKIDLIVGIYKNPERVKYLKYPEHHYYEEPVMVFIDKTRPFTFNRWQDLIGKRGGTVRGESFGEAFDRFALKNLKLQRVDSVSQTFKMMDRNRLDYSIYAQYPGKIKISDLRLQHTISPQPKRVAAAYAYQAFSKKSTFLQHLPYFNKRVMELKADGTVQHLIDKHMAQLTK